MTEKDVGLSGRLEAGRRFRNKIRLGAEAGALAAAFSIYSAQQHW